MGSLPSDSESPISIQNKEMDFPEMGFEESIQTRRKKDVWSKKKKKKGKGQVFLEGYVETDDREKVVEQKGVARTKSLTDDDLDELKGCLDLGFGFNYEEIPELCNTLPALELCYSMSQRFLDEQHRVSDASNEGATATETTCSSGLTSSPIANWKISSPGDHPEEVKARLKFWAQAVACTVRLCR
ncbi:hypothetical protein CKAN_02623800 [Cinnamomum micranthum f. kanehirae]|uniref:Uncharacterized protein n=1 Tax=Cinnamomum micranthum f. kanehirae TaxID=337451 RepID=A0A3S3NYB6_9MAGN|nr:hypothetical protein CKAN_02623800 [Cinnamomum micranthum f. kanehirae]